MHALHACTQAMKLSQAEVERLRGDLDVASSRGDKLQVWTGVDRFDRAWAPSLGGL